MLIQEAERRSKMVEQNPPELSVARKILALKNIYAKDERTVNSDGVQEVKFLGLRTYGLESVDEELVKGCPTTWPIVDNTVQVEAYELIYQNRVTYKFCHWGYTNRWGWEVTPAYNWGLVTVDDKISNVDHAAREFFWRWCRFNIKVPSTLVHAGKEQITVLWIMMRRPCVLEKKYLARLYGKYELRHEKELISETRVAEIVALYTTEKFDEVVVGKDKWLAASLCKLGIKPLMPIFHEDTFLRFVRVADIELSLSYAL